MSELPEMFQEHFANGQHSETSCAGRKLANVAHPGKPQLRHRIWNIGHLYSSTFARRSQLSCSHEEHHSLSSGEDSDQTGSQGKQHAKGAYRATPSGISFWQFEDLAQPFQIALHSKEVDVPLNIVHLDFPWLMIYLATYEILTHTAREHEQ